ncbi:DUF1579 domain-containing protein [Engelhardtia mirabilis]|uniref:DUF1579 domain-containing protein n=1 Tax=Engelhardtia mirabilis TaxID=2528011 RepID=UPI0011A0AD2B
MHTTATAASIAAALALGFAAGNYEPTPSKAPTGQEPSMDEMMAAWEEAGTPGDHHRLLDPFVGTYTAKAKFWMAPGQPPTESAGKMVTEWILDGHQLKQTYHGDMMGEEFEGLSLWGYDNAAKTYRGVWVDSMSTGMSISAGYVSDDGKVFTMFASDTDPMTGEEMQSEDRIEVIDNNTQKFTRWGIMGDERMKMMEIVYTRTQAK